MTELNVCGFCERPQEEVGRMIAGPETVRICSDCIGRCNLLLTEDSEPVDAIELIDEVLRYADGLPPDLVEEMTLWREGQVVR